MLTDLARRRDTGRAQLARLRADRDRLVAVFDDAGRSVEDVLAGLRAAFPEPADTPDVETVDEALAAVAAESLPGFTSRPVAAVVAENATNADTSELETARGRGEPAVAIHLGEEPALTYAGELDIAPAAEPDAEADSERRDTVDDLFAKLRAAGPAEVAAAAQSLPVAAVVTENATFADTSEGEAAAEVGTEAAGDAAEGAGDAAEGAEPEPAEPAGPDDAYFAERAVALDLIQQGMARHLKRALTNEQNEVLDALRRARTADEAASLDALVGTEDAHAERYRSAVTAEVRAAALAGAASVGTARDVPSSEVLDGVLAEVTADFVVPLRERLTKALEGRRRRRRGGGSHVRAAYREWRTQRADEIAAHLVLVSHGLGAFDAVALGTPIRWVVDPEGPLCPDADDNSLAGVVSAGEPFPTGHCHAPAHPGCRCGIEVTEG